MPARSCRRRIRHAASEVPGAGNRHIRLLSDDGPWRAAISGSRTFFDRTNERPGAQQYRQQLCYGKCWQFFIDRRQQHQHQLCRIARVTQRIRRDQLRRVGHVHLFAAIRAHSTVDHRGSAAIPVENSEMTTMLTLIRRFGAESAQIRDHRRGADDHGGARNNSARTEVNLEPHAPFLKGRSVRINLRPTVATGLRLGRGRSGAEVSEVVEGASMAETSIEWTDATWNPVAGCTVLTAGCTNCYAMRMAACRTSRLL